jgi:hypothetical protein
MWKRGPFSDVVVDCFHLLKREAYRCALALCDIAEHIMDHDLPFDIRGAEFALLRIYQQLYHNLLRI